MCDYTIDSYIPTVHPEISGAAASAARRRSVVAARLRRSSRGCVRCGVLRRAVRAHGHHKQPCLTILPQPSSQSGIPSLAP
eukprot:3375434-Pleurochrysis_carterae.AAC.1